MELANNADFALNGEDVVMHFKGQPWKLVCCSAGYCWIREVKGTREVIEYLPEEQRHWYYYGDQDIEAWKAAMRIARDNAIKRVRKLK